MASTTRFMVRPAGLEPATTYLEGTCSIQLSYGRVLIAETQTILIFSPHNSKSYRDVSSTKKSVFSRKKGPDFRFA